MRWQIIDTFIALDKEAGGGCWSEVLLTRSEFVTAHTRTSCWTSTRRRGTARTVGTASTTTTTRWHLKVSKTWTLRLYQFNPDGTESTFKSKLFLMSWCPDSAKIKKKMLYSSSFDTLKRAFVGVHKVIQANDKSECEQVLSVKTADNILHSLPSFSALWRKFSDQPTGFKLINWILIAQLWFWCYWI